MKKGFIPMSGIDGWQLSNTNVLAAAAVNASLKLFADVGMSVLRKKSLTLTGYAESLVNELSRSYPGITILTPADPEARGCQLSIQLAANGKKVYDYLSANGVIADWREPNQENEQAGVIRIAPVPLYNRYLDVHNFYTIFESALKSV